MKFVKDPLCEDCREHGRVKTATQVHHMEPVVRRPDIAFVMENLRSVCTTCHAQREAASRCEPPT